jgi:hypothetical protein
VKLLGRHSAVAGMILIHTSLAKAEPNAAQKALATQLFGDATKATLLLG